jgi:Icc-related predicted phosphoesterase
VLAAQLRDAGVHVLEGSGVVLPVDGRRVGVAGAKGFGGGFPGKHASEFGEPEMKAFIRHTKEVSARLRDALVALDCDVRIALTHYSPVRDTLAGEPPEIHPFLGSYHLAEAIDAAPADLAVHGHAHLGSEKGLTPAGVRVRNVAHPVIKQAYAVYTLP